MSSAFLVHLLWFRFAGDRLAVWPALAAVHGLLLSGFVFVFMWIFGGDAFPTLNTSILCFVLGAASTATQSVMVRRARLNEALTKLNAQLRDAVTEIERRSQAIQSRATRSLHNDVQAKLLRISLMLGSKTVFDQALLREVEEQLREIEVDATEQPRASQNFTAALEEISDFGKAPLQLK